MLYPEALEFVRERRPCISPNQGFVKALKEWEAIRREAREVQGTGESSA